LSSVVFPPTHVAIFGRPGSGKSSLAERLGADFGYVLVRTGELLREAIRRGDHLGRRVEVHLASGTLVPDRLIFELLEQSLAAPGASKLLFDGFPRTMGQAALLEQFEHKLGFQTDCYLEVMVSRQEAVSRITGRRLCPVCGSTYHIRTMPPKSPGRCDRDGATLTTRPDDSIDVVQVRQNVYEEFAGPLLEHYRAHAPERFRAVNGEQPFQAVYAETCGVLKLRPTRSE
jgi:adenylate kinase